MPQQQQQKRSFIVPKLLYICLYSLYGSAIAYIAIFYSEALHLSANQIGIILAIAPFVQVIACPLWTWIADRFPHWHGPLMGILATIGGSSVMTLYFLPTLLFNNMKGSLLDEKNNEKVMMITATCALIFAFCGSPVCALVDSAVLKMLGDQKLLYGNQRLWGSVSNGTHILVVGLLISKYGISVSFKIFFVGLTTFVILSMLFVRFDEHMMDPKENNNMTPDIVDDVIHSQQQQGESEGEATAEESRSLLLAGKSTSPNAITGTNYMYDPSIRTLSHHQQQQQQQQQQGYFLSRRQSQQSSQNVITRRGSIANTVYLSDDQQQFNNLLTNTNTTSLMAIDVQLEANHELLQDDSSYPSLGLVLSYIPTLDTSLSAFALLGQQPEDNNSIIIPDKSILKSLRVYTFMTSILLYGIAHSMTSQFLFLLLKNLGLSSSTMGWTGPIGGVAEVITFWISRRLFDKYSVTSLMTLAYMSFIFRALTYTCLTPYETKSIIIALLLHIINGFAYALIWSTAVFEVDSFFPIEQKSIAQGILAALFSGLGYGIGCLLGGYILNLYGQIVLFQLSATICGFSLVVFLLGRR